MQIYENMCGCYESVSIYTHNNILIMGGLY